VDLEVFYLGHFKKLQYNTIQYNTCLAEWQVLSVCCRTESASSIESEHRAVAGVDFIAKSSSVDMPNGAVRAPVAVTILPVSNCKSLWFGPKDPGSHLVSSYSKNARNALVFHMALVALDCIIRIKVLKQLSRAELWLSSACCSRNPSPVQH